MNDLMDKGYLAESLFGEDFMTHARTLWLMAKDVTSFESKLTGDDMKKLARSHIAIVIKSYFKF